MSAWLARIRVIASLAFLFSAKFVEFGFFENRFAGRKIGPAGQIVPVFGLVLKFVVITVTFTCYNQVTPFSS